MNKYKSFSLKIILISVMMLFISGCGSKPPVLQPIPNVQYAQSPRAPVNQDLSRSFVIYKTPTDKQELDLNVTKKNNFRLKADAKVVISVPVEQQKLEKGKVREEEMFNRISSYNTSKETREELTKPLVQNFNANNGQGAEGAVFSTAEYFNKAEQEIEKSLLRKNFTVLDRSKFEAELRNRRIDKREQKQSKAQQEELKNLTELRDTNQITKQQHDERLKDLESKFQVVNALENRKAGENELVDISELIRAAESGMVQADYILQVNSFDIGPISDSQLYLTEKEPVRKLLIDHPQLAQAMEYAGAATIVQPGYYGYLNAKLINVKTGSIVWVGEHRVESINVEDIRIGLTMSRRVANKAAVAQAIRTYNNALQYKVSKAKQTGQSTQIQGADSGLIQRRLSEYNSLVSDIKLSLGKEPMLPAWRYKYAVAQPIVSPSFPSEFALKKLQSKSNQSQSAQNEFLRIRDRMGRHQSSLAKVVARELIMTIPSGE